MWARDRRTQTVLLGEGVMRHDSQRERERDGGRLARRKPKAKWPCPIVVVAGQMCRNRETLSLAAAAAVV